MKISAKNEPTARPTDASEFEKESTKPVPAKKPPLQIIPITQQMISTITGSSISIR